VPPSTLVAALAAAAVLALHEAPTLASPVGSPPAPVAAAIAGPRLAGEGPLRWFGLRVYQARLWVGADGLDPERLQRTPFALDLQYSRAIGGAAIAEASHREIARLGHGTEPQRQRWLDAMRRIFPDVGEGDRLTGVHQPGAGVSFFKNDRRVGGIDDPAFAAAFFSIWLDARTVAPELRSALLARAEPQRGETR
jgi:hypothetical protein